MTTEITLSGILTEQEICQRFNVTPEEIDKANRIIDMSTGEVFYQVESRSGGETHEVRYNRKFKRLTCTCEAGRVGIPCWAKRAAMAAALEYKQGQRIAAAKEQAEQERELAAQRGRAAKAEERASQKRAYESDKDWQQQERAANRAPLARQELKFETVNGRSIPMR